MSTQNGSFYTALFEDLRLVEVWHFRKAVAAFAFIGLMFGLVYLHVTPNEYTATLQVTTLPTQSQVDSIASRFGSNALASLTGMSATSQSPNFQLYLEAIFSNVIADKLSQNQRLMHEVFALEWDPVAKKWRAPSGVFLAIKNPVRWIVGLPPSDWHPPGMTELKKYIGSNVTVTQEKNKQIVKITLENRNKALAADLLSNLSAASDGYVKSIALERADKYTEYLVAALRSATVEDVRQALIAALVEQEKIRMMANSNLSYAAQQVGSAYVSPNPTSPNPISSLIGGMLIGGFLGVVAVLARLQLVEQIDDWLIAVSTGKWRRGGRRYHMPRHHESEEEPLVSKN